MRSIGELKLLHHNLRFDLIEPSDFNPEQLTAEIEYAVHTIDQACRYIETTFDQPYYTARLFALMREFGRRGVDPSGLTPLLNSIELVKRI